MAHTPRWLFSLSVGLMLMAAPASAQTIIGNLPQTNDGASYNVLGGNHRAVSFTLGSTSYSLTGATLRALAEAGAAPELEIRNDSGGSNPGVSTLATFTNPVFGGGTQNYGFTPSSALTLQANTKYWLYAKNPGSGSFFWFSSSPAVTPTGPGATFGAFVDGNGTTWAPTARYGTFEIQGNPLITGGDAVPEPSAMVLLLPALSLLVLLKRRRA